MLTSATPTSPTPPIGPGQRFLSRLFADYHTLRTTPGGASRLVLAIVPIAVHREKLGEDLPPALAMTVEGLESLLAQEDARPADESRGVTTILQGYLAALPGYLPPVARSGGPPAADASEMHARYVQRVPCLMAAAAASAGQADPRVATLETEQ